jgi:N utilization substance protein A
MLLVKLFEMEVPEIFDGVVEVIHAAREPGRRAKISVFTNDDDVDPVGACVGLRGARVQAIVNELHGEKVDIVRWSDDIETYARNALAPAEVENMTILSGTREIHVKVDPSQLSLAIGRQGVNVRLASKLVGYKINVTTTDPQETLSIEEQLRQQLGEASREREAQEALEAAEAEALQSEETPEEQESDATDTPEAVEAAEDTEAAEPEADSTDPEPSAEVDESSSESAGPEESKAVSAD